MSSVATPAAVPPNAARLYNRVHCGRLMLVHHADARPFTIADFFQFESAGTHPTGLFVTGVFADSNRRHMLAGAVRDATTAEIEWYRTATDAECAPQN